MEYNIVMEAEVLTNEGDHLLVRDTQGMEVLVHTPKKTEVCPGDRVYLRYDGAMTRSLPPQITAGSVEVLH